MKVNEFGQAEYAIGEVFEEDGVRLVAVESGECDDCFFYDKHCSELACVSYKRDDKKGVIFVPAVCQNETK